MLCLIIRIMDAAEDDKADIIKELLESTIALDVQGKIDRTALIAATDEGNTECVKLLLNAGANPDIQDKEGETALMKAASKGKAECVKPLLIQTFRLKTARQH